jgi:hypothetical protein
MEPMVSLRSLRGDEVTFTFSDGRQYRIGKEGSPDIRLSDANLIVKALAGRVEIVSNEAPKAEAPRYEEPKAASKKQRGTEAEAPVQETDSPEKDE